MHPNLGSLDFRPKLLVYLHELGALMAADRAARKEAATSGSRCGWNGVPTKTMKDQCGSIICLCYVSPQPVLFLFHLGN